MNVEDAKKIISNAIDRETEAYVFYNSVSERAKEPEKKNFLANVQMKRRNAGRSSRHSLRGTRPTSTSKQRKTIRSATHLPSPKLTDDLSPLKGLVVAIKKELEAMQMYTQLANLSTDTDQELLFFQLANMERTHKARLEEICTNMAFPEVW